MFKASEVSSTGKTGVQGLMIETFIELIGFVEFIGPVKCAALFFKISRAKFIGLVWL
jgi:hypothetical protein